MHPTPDEGNPYHSAERNKRDDVRTRGQGDLAEYVSRAERECSDDAGDQVREHQRARRLAVAVASTSPSAVSFTP